MTIVIDMTRKWDLTRKWRALARWLFDTPEDDTFTALVQVATEDAEIRTQLLAVLQLPNNDRQIRLQYWLDTMKAEGAPRAFTDALAHLRHDEIANKLKKILTESNNRNAN